MDNQTTIYLCTSKKKVSTLAPSNKLKYQLIPQRTTDTINSGD